MMRFIAALLVVCALAAAEHTLSDQFYAAIRSGDTAAVRQLLKSGADVNLADNRGATPLHYAAAVGTPDTVRMLLDAGAKVDARTAFGATPLLWAAPSLAKVQLLVEKGADVNARSKPGNTALLLAACQNGSLETVRYLLAHGAALEKARNEAGQTPLLRAARAGDFEAVRFLVGKGEDVNVRDRLGFTPLTFAAMNGDAGMLRLFLGKGAEVNTQLVPSINTVKNGPIGIGRLSPLMFAALSENPEAVRLLLDAGADLNATDARGLTPLMLAVASDHASPEVVRLLLDRKPDLTIRSAMDETAAMWAAKFRHVAALPLLAGRAAPPPATKATLAAAQQPASVSIRQAAEKSMALMQKMSASFLRDGGCVSCHAQHITGTAAAFVRRAGLRYDAAAAEDVVRATRLEFASRADQFLERIDGPADTILTTALTALAAQDSPPDRTIDAMLRSIAGQQQPDGRWGAHGILRPPTADGDLSLTASTIHVLRRYAAPALNQEMDARIAAATRWLVAAESSTTEDAVAQLLGAKWGGADAAMLGRFQRHLLALQRDGGGWSQTRELPADAYATATALYALHEGGGLPASAPAYRRGVRFLLDTQAEDGSWHVVSRAPKFQPYFESGFPYGHDQWISQWATGWSTIALSLAVPRTAAAR